MGTARPPQPVKLFVRLISESSSMLKKATNALERLFGPIELATPISPWNHTSYYERELGPNLNRQFLFFSQRIQPDRLAEIKEKTNELEKRWSTVTQKGRYRRINLDPGYVALPKVVLATTKDFSHRIYLSRGIYAEVTLIFRGRSFEPQNTTYPEFRAKDHIELFNKIRDSLF